MHLHRVTPDPFQNYSYSVGGKFLGTSSHQFKASTNADVRFGLKSGHPSANGMSCPVRAKSVPARFTGSRVKLSTDRAAIHLQGFCERATRLATAGR